MYDILQLNDMLVPELLDIAEQLNIPNVKKLDKQGLVYKILDSQAVAGSKGAANTDDKGKRKRIIKATTGNTTEEAVIEDHSAPPTAVEKKIIKKAGASQSSRKEEKPPVKKTRKKVDEKEPVEPTIEEEHQEPDVEEASFEQEDQQTGQPGAANINRNAPATGAENNFTQNKPFQHRREQNFNIEFDGVILSEGVLEMMPDGYGFLRSSDYNYLS